MPTAIKILLIDDHTLLRDTLRERLDDEIDLHVVAVAGDADEGERLALELGPDVIVMDIDMPGQICFDVAKNMLRQLTNARVVFLSAFHNDRYIESALKAGALSYVTKDESADTVVDAVRRAAAGVAYFSPKVRSRLVIEPDETVSLQSQGGTRLALLTDRELEILRYIARGMSKKEVAAVLNRSYSTVDKHTENIMKKLEIHDRVGLARFAIREGLAEA